VRRCESYAANIITHDFALAAFHTPDDADDGHHTRAIQAYTALAPQRFKEFFRD
jgi:hypothetical protein